MGMFDEIEGNVTCPYCGQVTTVRCQVKWLVPELRSCNIYHVGDYMPCIDATYTGATTVRKWLDSKCKNCNEIINLTATVKDGKLYSIDPLIMKGDNNETT